MPWLGVPAGPMVEAVGASISLQVVERFVDIEKLTKLVERQDEKKFKNKEAIAIRAFRSALKRRAEGKPDDLRDRGGEEFEEVVD